MKQNKLSSKAKIAILLVIVVVPSLFAAAAVGTSKLFTAAPIVLIAALLIASGIYTGYVATRLYKFFGVSCPWYAYVPCFGEVALLDGTFINPATILYVTAAVLIGIGQLPYSVMKILGDFAMVAPFWFTASGFVALAIIQIIKGVGMAKTMRVVSDIWEERFHTSLGLIRASTLLNFIPFVRVISVYCLAKPLSTMVDFNGMNVQDEQNISLSE